MDFDLQKFTEEAITRQRSGSLRKGIRSYQKVIATHEEKIKNPENFYPEWNNFSELEKNGYIKHWKKEIKTAKESIQYRIDELKKRGEDIERIIDT